MIMTLKHNFKISDNQILNALALKPWNNQAELAEYLSIGLSTLERKVRVLKENSSLQVFRYKGNNFIYCIGDDIVNILDSRSAKETLKFRLYWQGSPIIDTELENMLKELPIFIENQNKSNMGKDFIKEPRPEQIIFQEMFLDWLSEAVVVKHELEPIIKKANSMDWSDKNMKVLAEKFFAD